MNRYSEYSPHEKDVIKKTVMGYEIEENLTELVYNNIANAALGLSLATNRMEEGGRVTSKETLYAIQRMVTKLLERCE